MKGSCYKEAADMPYLVAQVICLFLKTTIYVYSNSSG